ncbi:unnamed protein product [Caenorhabditis angaria]|uniref:Transmembrane protein 188 n=1 Tax=Caenorhabditis angaria TaxID=860376 RepID=A0A9P1I5S2_9PELO|nr:unnamed protein product [Caenorhabditis angaria]
MDDATTACEDLKFFEKRLTEVINYMGPTCTRWRISVAIVVVAVVIGVTGTKWMTNTEVETMTLSHFLLTAHLDFTVCIVVAVLLFGVFGVHRRVVAPTIIARRCRDALSPFSLSCDHNGKLIVKPAIRNSAP